MVMIISTGILEGFKSQIRQKIFSFSAHIQVTKYDLKKSYEESPLSLNTRLFRHPNSVQGIAHIQMFSNKPGLIRTKEDIMGVVLKGVWKDFDLSEFNKNIVAGEFISFPDSANSNQIMVSQKIADRLNLKIGEPVIMIFTRNFSNIPLYRKLFVSGTYETGLEEFDEHFVLGDIRLNRKINDWADTVAGGYEIFVKDFSKIDTIGERVFDYMDYDMQIEKVTNKYIQIFEWLKLLDRNVLIFLILILFVASFNMIATLFIMIMERTSMIGILKALGAKNRQIQQIFIYNGAYIILKGMFWGNLVGLGFCLLEDLFHFVPLDPENYYMSFVPIKFNWFYIGAVNLITFLIVTTVLLIPAFVISKMKPIRAIRFA